MRMQGMAGAGLALSGVAFVVLAFATVERVVDMTVDEAAPASLVLLSGGSWDCDAGVPQPLAPYRGERKVVFVDLGIGGRCSPSESHLYGELVSMPDATYQSLVAHSGEWAALSRQDALLFHERVPESPFPILLLSGIGMIVSGAVLLVWTPRPR